MVLGRLPAQGLSRQQTDTHPPVICEGGFLACSGAPACGAGFRFSTHLVDYGAALKECRLWIPSWHSPSASFQYLPERAYILVWSPDFCDCQVTWPAELTLMVLQKMYMCTFPYFKKPLPEGLASKQPETRGRDPPTRDADRSWHILNYWELLKI